MDKIGIGEEQYQTFVEERLVKGQVMVSSPIRKNQFVLPRDSKPCMPHAGAICLTDKDFNKLRSACEQRESPCKNLFKTEFTGVSEAFTKNGGLYSGIKSDLLKNFVSGTSNDIDDFTPEVFVIELSVISNIIAAITRASSFTMFAQEILSSIVGLSRSATRLDIVTDSYFAASLKTKTRTTRGVGSRFVFTGDTPLPSNFQKDFLRNNDNKTDLNRFLVQYIMDYYGQSTSSAGPLVYATIGNVISCNMGDGAMAEDDVLRIACSKEEADLKIIVYIKHSLISGFFFNFIDNCNILNLSLIHI